MRQSRLASQAVQLAVVANVGLIGPVTDFRRSLWVCFFVGTIEQLVHVRDVLECHLSRINPGF